MTKRYESPLPPGNDGFANLVRSEWTKLRTLPGWLAGLAVAVFAIAGLGLFISANTVTACSRDGKDVACPQPPLGPDGTAVADKFRFVSQQLSGDGRLTVRVRDLSGRITYPPPDNDEIVSATVPWAKAGIMVKASTDAGSSYAAVMTTAEHGVRMQHDFRHDTAGKSGRPSGEKPRWLRLDRAGDTVTGYESRDGREWSKVDSVRLPELPDTVRIGMFVASPGDVTIGETGLGGSFQTMRLATATGVFDEVAAPGKVWDSTDVGATTDPDGLSHHPGETDIADGVFTVTGDGDIAPHVDGRTPESTLPGIWLGLIALVIVAVSFATAEFRGGLARVTLLANPRRGRVVAAKALVIGGVTFAVSLLAVTATWFAATALLRRNGNYILPLSTTTTVRVLVGVAAVLALAAVLGLAIGALLRRATPAALAVAGVMVAPMLLAIAAPLPDFIPQWLLRVTPAAGFAIQQSIPEYPQVLGDYRTAAGYYPLPPWAGLAVLAGFTVVALAAAIRRVERRDA